MDILDGAVAGDGRLGMIQERGVQVEERIALVEKDVGIHDEQELGLAARQRVNERVPGMVAAGFLDLGHAADQGVGKRMRSLLLGKDRRSDLRRAIVTPIRDANHLTALLAAGQFLKERLLKDRLQAPPDDGFLVPGPDANGEPRWVGGLVVCHGRLFKLPQSISTGTSEPTSTPMNLK
jgi:hypothetical protein